jgi:hypothetical protein
MWKFFIHTAIGVRLKKERGWVEDQPQGGETSPGRWKFEPGHGWSRTTQPRSGFFKQTLKSGLLAVLFCLSTSIPHSANAAGVTVITHGLNGNADGWVTGMANAITHYYRFPGTTYTIYKLYFVPDGNGYDLTWSRLAGSPPANTDSGEILVAFDWSQLSDGTTYNTYQIATVLAAALLSTNFISELNGHALCEMPVHLIGHSRGGSLMCQTCLLLGTNGVWVDHLTTLDPHPLNNDGFILDFLAGYTVKDAPCKTYQSVLFHDNCWENLSLVHGESVAGAFVRKLTDLSGGYQNTGDSYYQHSNTHLWYHGSIDLNTPASDTEATITSAERTNWWDSYEDQGLFAGFYYSLIGGGDRTNPGLPGGPVIRDGYNQDWDLGGGTNANRTVLPANNGTWPNLITFNLAGTNVVAGNAIGATYYYQYAGASNLTLQICFDRDLNPYTPNNIPVLQLQSPATGAGNVYYQNLGLPTTNVPPGTYAVCGKISDGVHTRYLYTPALVTVLAVQPPPVLDIAKLNDTQFLIGVNGVTNQTVVLETSTDLQSWLPLATNNMTSIRWVYTNTVPMDFDKQFYRAVVGR